MLLWYHSDGNCQAVHYMLLPQMYPNVSTEGQAGLRYKDLPHVVCLIGLANAL